MGRHKLIKNMFNPDSPVKKHNSTPSGDAGYDNVRENVDPHIKTKVLDTKEIVQDGVSYDLSAIGGGVDWTVSQAPTVIHADNYTDTNTTYVSSDFTHNDLTGYVANEHIDWTNSTDNFSTTGTIHSNGNITTNGSVDGIDVAGMSAFVVLNSAHRNDAAGADHTTIVTAVGLNTSKVTSKWEVDGTETQLITADEIDMQSKKIINVTDPTANQEAATKKYVDDNAGGTSIKSNWGYVAGDGDTSCSEAVTFDSAFTNIPDVVVNCLGYKNGVPSDRGDVSVGNDYFCTAQNPSTTSFTLVATDAAGNNIAAAGALELDYMEYATDELAQAAYVSSEIDGSDVIPDMTSNTAPSGVVSAKTEDNPAWNAFDKNTGTSWRSTGYPTWIKYDFGAGNEKIITKITVDPFDSNDVRDWVFSGSNDDADWTELASGRHIQSSAKFTETFTNFTTYRYYKFDVINQYSGSQAAIKEIEMIETVLQCYSEATIKQQGSYSLKGITVKTDSLNDTLTRSAISPTIDLSGINTIKFYIYASRTGNNIKIGIHDSGGTTTESTPNITDANTWQNIDWDLSGVADVNKDDIDSIIITIINADAANTFYIDNMFGTTVARNIAYSWLAKEPGTD